MEEDGFKLVQSKKRSKKRTKKRPNALVNECVSQDCDGKEDQQIIVNKKEFCERILKSANDFFHSEFFLKFANDCLVKHQLIDVVFDNTDQTNRQIPRFTSTTAISRIICLGLGSFTSSKEAEHQLVFLKCLTKVLGLDDCKESTKVSVFDPIHSKCEEDIIRELGFDYDLKRSTSDEKYSIAKEPNSGTLFYLPHCPKQLTSDILWSNWKPNILGSSPVKEHGDLSCGLYILGNSFEGITTSLPDRLLKESAEYILLASKFVFETKVCNCYKYSDIFNDTSLHSFPIDKLPHPTDAIWATEKGGDVI